MFTTHACHTCVRQQVVFDVLPAVLTASIVARSPQGAVPTCEFPDMFVWLGDASSTSSITCPPGHANTSLGVDDCICVTPTGKLCRHGCGFGTSVRSRLAMLGQNCGDVCMHNRDAQRPFAYHTLTQKHPGSTAVNGVNPPMHVSRRPTQADPECLHSYR